MRWFCKLFAVLTVVASHFATSSPAVLAQRLPTQPVTAPITLNDTTVAGSALVSDQIADGDVAAQPPKPLARVGVGDAFDDGGIEPRHDFARRGGEG